MCHLPSEITRLPHEYIAIAIFCYILDHKVESIRYTKDLFRFKIPKYEVIFQGFSRGAKHLPGILDLGTFFKLVQDLHKAEAKKKTWRLFKNSVLISSHVRDVFYPIS